MSVSEFQARLKASSANGFDSQDFDLNLAPIIDCFTVLIAFVMISTAFASIGILDAGIAAGGDKAISAAIPPVRISVEVLADHRFNLKISGKENREITIPARGDSWDHGVLKIRLDEIKNRFPSVNGAVITAVNSVKYDSVIRTMEQIRTTFPAVMLGGL
ncbi:MAG TPA: hypothetical protein DCS07_06675 [Bdellovibrionales bacterium]|nr:MAG: hypothetical protein A2Z97_08170 [Bdellovibrionales bacterium GWB1_52_6]OFZ03824.1 MAG: hypothetical protein A2X97_15610 [Bdellovibrionales bacterium GWA1_52_35]OFZ39616.1 MAG: hypothetical protein A2070_05920 [Bdellovibrionales bacterium GWC1_52_8]HAR42302.1 hypothetical protein [Bdellovibrionales bacterium]HCM39741.1 hypothetical protein [Bdellovibrionales bacterium]